jgi:CRISPR/Cas system CSM-associated protein Csm3 (group 7 of RAMP superfamily)
MPQPNAKPISRWRITGRILTDAPLHIGDGRRVPLDGRDCKKDFLNAAPEYATVMTTRAGIPILPATGVKGALRAWVETHIDDPRIGDDPTLVEETFGSMKSGGLIAFHDARIVTPPLPPQGAAESGMWSKTRMTSVGPQVVLNPLTRAAEESLLYYVEYVPPGAQFEISFVGQGETARHRALLLYALENAFRSPDRPAALGSGAANGWGRVTWTRGVCEVLDSAKWLAAPARPWWSGMEAVSDATVEEWRKADRFAPKSGRSFVTLHLLLAFDGAMLINDPSRQRKGGDRDGEAPVSHVTMRTHREGDPYLPASSVRGAFRAQARRIWQTIFEGNASHDLNRVPFDAQQAARGGAQSSLAEFLKLFGATGWRAPIEFSDFKLSASGKPHRQEFVAVDRFTGGVAGGKKFAAETVWQPQFTGTVSIRADRLFSPATGEDESANAGAWVWLLLAWTLRDWAEGDGRIGFGRSKGYGAFRASLTSADGSPEGDLLRRIVEREASALASPMLEDWSNSLDKLLRKQEAA